MPHHTSSSNASLLPFEMFVLRKSPCPELSEAIPMQDSAIQNSCSKIFT